MKQVNNTELLTCFFLTSLLCGCAYKTLIPYQSFKRIEIISPDSRTSLDAIPSRSESEALAPPGVADARIENELNHCIEDLAHQINKLLTEQTPTEVDRSPETDV